MAETKEYRRKADGYRVRMTAEEYSQVHAADWQLHDKYVADELAPAEAAFAARAAADKEDAPKAAPKASKPAKAARRRVTAPKGDEPAPMPASEPERPIPATSDDDGA